jgi:tetratricopeptide (TPR) repeat protein
MKLAAILVFLGVAVASTEAAQRARAGSPPPQPSDQMAEAYNQFLRAHMLEDANDVEGAIAAYKLALQADPSASDASADLASLYQRENRTNEAIAAAEQSLKISPGNREAHRVLGTVYATQAGRSPGRGGRDVTQQSLAKAMDHLEKAIEPATPATDPNLRAMLAQVYMAVSNYDKAIPILVDLVKQEPGWQQGPALLVEAYSAAGRGADAVAWLEEAAPGNPQLYGTLADFYGRERRWADAAGAYEQALRRSPRSFDLRVRMASSLLNTGSRADVLKARDALREAIGMRGTDERALYLLSQAERRSGDREAAEATARKLIAQNGKNARGYFALAEALEEQRRLKPLIEALEPAVATFRGTPDGVNALAMLLPHLGFAYQELGQHDKAIAVFEEARKIAPDDPALAGYVIQAHLSAKNYAVAADIAHAARTRNPKDLRLVRLEAQALRRVGKSTEALALLEEVARTQSTDPDAHIMLAQGYVDANRGPQAVKVLQDAQSKFPGEMSIVFQLAAALEKQKRFMESEAQFLQLIAKEPENAPALNYLGYMLAERGERLGESVQYLKRALAIDPENGSYLDSIGWAYFKDGKLDLALENLRRAADRLLANSVVQSHYGEVLFRLGKYDEAIEAWSRALSGDGDDIDRGDIDRKIRAARQKLPRK